MTEEEARRLSAYISDFSQERNLGLNPCLYRLGNGEYVILLTGHGNYHVWSRAGWLRDYEPAQVLQEQEQEEAASWVRISLQVGLNIPIASRRCGESHIGWNAVHIWICAEVFVKRTILLHYENYVLYR